MEELNKEQLLAVMKISGPVLVFAGAGSGKTRTLTYRIINMIKNHNIPPYNILAITFTKKATNEMKERIQRFLDIDTTLLNISTFHALCAKILRVEIGLLGYRKDFTVLDEEDQQKFISDICKELNIDKTYVKKYQKQINNNKCFDIKVINSFDKDLVRVYEKYQEEMKDQNLLDFEDLLLKVLELFEKFPEVLEKYQNKFKYILVDEFQDTNLVQYKILRLLAYKHRNLFVVGDDDQSIYSFRGTNYENINLFKEDFSEYTSYILSKNYRSSKKIIEYANRLISHNKNREVKNMEAVRDGIESDCEYVNPEDEKEEARYIANKILHIKGSVDRYKDFAILYRSSALNRNIELEFIKMGIPYKIYGGLSYLRRKEIKDIIAYLRLIINHDDVNSFKRIYNVPSRGIGEATLEKVLEVRKANKVNVIEAIALSEPVLTHKRFEKLEELKDLIEKQSQMIEDENLLITFDRLIAKLNYKEYLKDIYEEEEADDRFLNVLEFKSILKEVEGKITGNNRIELLKEAFDDIVLADNQLQSRKQDEDGVTLSTIHSVKGLEFKYVFLIGLEESIFPKNNIHVNDEDIEEERRICYVAITRAMDKLFLMHDKSRLLFGRVFRNKPSIFLNEALGIKIFKKNTYDDYDDFCQVVETKPVKTLETKTELKLTDTSYSVGDSVNHDKFGPGIILSIKGDIGTIFFDKQKCSKTILLNHPALKKI